MGLPQWNAELGVNGVWLSIEECKKLKVAKDVWQQKATLSKSRGDEAVKRMEFLYKVVEKRKSEVKRLQALLARHKIRYKKEEQNA